MVIGEVREFVRALPQLAVIGKVGKWEGRQWWEGELVVAGQVVQGPQLPRAGRGEGVVLVEDATGTERADGDCSRAIARAGGLRRGKSNE